MLTPVASLRYLLPWMRPAGGTVLAVVLAVALAACEAGEAPATPPITPGVESEPREVNVIARDYAFDPPFVDVVPGETVRLHVVNAGLEIHEAVVGPPAVQEAWEEAQAATVGHPPGPTPVVSVPPEVAGLRLVVESGELASAVWTVPIDGPAEAGWVVGCHIPGHWARGMVVPIRWVGPGGEPLDTSALGVAARSAVPEPGTRPVPVPVEARRDRAPRRASLRAPVGSGRRFGSRRVRRRSVRPVHVPTTGRPQPSVGWVLRRVLALR